jgi:hypothetical protein
VDAPRGDKLRNCLGNDGRGPWCSGTADDSVDGLFGIDILDLFGDDDEKKSEHPATRVGTQHTERKRKSGRSGSAPAAAASLFPKL